MPSGDDGGAAFPVPNEANVNDQEGLSKREWFAGMALFKLIERWLSDDELDDWPAIAADAYKLADAMLTESQRNPDEKK